MSRPVTTTRWTSMPSDAWPFGATGAGEAGAGWLAGDATLPVLWAWAAPEACRPNAAGSLGLERKNSSPGRSRFSCSRWFQNGRSARSGAGAWQAFSIGRRERKSRPMHGVQASTALLSCQSQSPTQRFASNGAPKRAGGGAPDKIGAARAPGRFGARVSLAGVWNGEGCCNDTTACVAEKRRAACG
jgi:hypothetical protein